MLSRAQWSCCSQSPIGWRWFNRGKKRRAHLWGRPYLLAPQLGFPSWGVFYHVPLPSPYAPLPDPSPLTSDVHSEGCPDCSLCPLPPTPWNVSPALARKLWGCPLIPSPHSSWKNLPIPASIPSLAPRCSEWSLDTKGKDLGLPWYGCDPLFLCPRPCLLLSSVTVTLISNFLGTGRVSTSEPQGWARPSPAGSRGLAWTPAPPTPPFLLPQASCPQLFLQSPPQAQASWI